MPGRTRAATETRSLEELLTPTDQSAPVRQERARRSRQALLDAAAALFEVDGYDAVGTPEIAAAAGVAVGTFYRYFTDKHEVYLEIVRGYLGDAYRNTLAQLTPERFAGRGPHETLDETISLLFAHVLARPGMSRSFLAMAVRDPQVAELRRAFDEVSADRLANLIAAICPRAVVPDPGATAYVLYGSALECAYGLVGVYGGPPLDADRIRAALTMVIARALFP